MSYVIVNPYYQEWEISEEDNSITWDDIDSIVDYPVYNVPQGFEEVYVGLLDNYGFGENFNYNSTTLLNQIKNVIMANIPSFQGLSGSGVAYVKLQTHWDDGGMFYEKGVAFIVPFAWTKGSIASQIARLQQAKADLKDSINTKGGTVTNETIDEYAGKIDNIPIIVELTQAQYDALSVDDYDNNTYYLIVEE